MKKLKILSVLILISCSSCSDLFDSCGCKKEWFNRLEHNEIKNDLNNDIVEDRLKYTRNVSEKIPLNKLFFEDKITEKFLSSFNSAEKYRVQSEYTPSLNEIVFLNVEGEVIQLYKQNEEFENGYSVSHVQRFHWEFKNNELIITSPYDKNFKFGTIVNKNGDAKFIPDEAFLIEKGFSKDKLPSKVIDFCACKCEFKNRGFSDETASDSCEIYLEDTRDRPNWELFGGTKFY